MSERVLAVIETSAGDGAARYAGLIAAANRLAADRGSAADALLVGPGSPAVSGLYASSPLEHVFTAPAVADDVFSLPPAVDAVAAAAARSKATIILIAQTTFGRELAGAVAARLEASVMTDAQALRIEDGRLIVTATKLGGAAIVECSADLEHPVVVLARPGAFEAGSDRGTPETVAIGVTSAHAQIHARVITAETNRDIALEEADAIVSGGRGLGGPEPFNGMLADLAHELGAAVGASRAVVDAGWVSHAHQVGQTGKTVRPRLYIAVAISGAIQHRVGMQTAGTIVALNKDANVPIADYADLLVVGDAFAVVPELTRLLREEKGHS